MKRIAVSAILTLIFSVGTVTSFAVNDMPNFSQWTLENSAVLHHKKDSGEHREKDGDKEHRDKDHKDKEHKDKDRKEHKEKHNERHDARLNMDGEQPNSQPMVNQQPVPPQGTAPAEPVPPQQ